MVITGTQADTVYRNLQRFLKEGESVRCSPLRDFSETTDIVLICPSSARELNEIGVNIRNAVCLPVIVTSPELFQINHTLPAVYIPDSEFGLEFAGNLAAYNYVSKDMEDLYSILHWARTGTLMSFLVHNMNNVLTRIMGNVELATLFAGDSEKQTEKLEIAVEGSETLRDILSDLSKYSKVIEDDGENWSTSYLDALLKMVRMSAGRSVELVVQSLDSGVEFPVRRLKYDSLLGTMFTAATLCVSGNGTMYVAPVEKEDCIGISIEWTSNKGDDEISEGFYKKGLVLMHTLAAFAPPAGCGYVIEYWGRTTGKALLTVPLAK